MSEVVMNSEVVNTTTALAAEKMAQIESKIVARQAEINHKLFQGEIINGLVGQDGDKNHRMSEEEEDDDDEFTIKSDAESSSQSLEDLIMMWEERLTKSTARGGMVRYERDEVLQHKTNIPTIPDLVYVTSTDSEDTRDQPPTSNSDEYRNPVSSPRVSSPRAANVFLELLTPPGRESGRPETKWQVLQQKIDERDQKIGSLESVINSDTDIFHKMKGTLEKMVHERNEMKSNTDTLMGQVSSQENIIEFLKTEMVNLLIKQQVDENVQRKELDNRDRIIASLEGLFQDNAEQTQLMIKQLGTRNSSLEDEIERLRAENINLLIQAVMLEEEKQQAKEDMNTELQLLYIETGRHEIL